MDIDESSWKKCNRQKWDIHRYDRVGGHVGSGWFQQKHGMASFACMQRLGMLAGFVGMRIVRDEQERHEGRFVPRAKNRDLGDDDAAHDDVWLEKLYQTSHRAFETAAAETVLGSPLCLSVPRCCC